jgi:hypothetical protein
MKGSKKIGFREVKLVMNDGTWNYPTLIPNKNFRGPNYYYQVPENAHRQTIKIELNVAGNSELNSTYFLLISSQSKEVLPLNRLNYGP